GVCGSVGGRQYAENGAVQYAHADDEQRQGPDQADTQRNHADDHDHAERQEQAENLEPVLVDGLARGFQGLPGRQAAFGPQRGGQHVGDAQVNARYDEQQGADVDKRGHQQGSDEQGHEQAEAAEHVVEADRLIRCATYADHVDACHEGIGQRRGQDGDDELADDDAGDAGFGDESEHTEDRADDGGRD